MQNQGEKIFSNQRLKVSLQENGNDAKIALCRNPTSKLQEHDVPTSKHS
jgi:hypothetical protein